MKFPFCGKELRTCLEAEDHLLEVERLAIREIEELRKLEEVNPDE